MITCLGLRRWLIMWRQHSSYQCMNAFCYGAKILEALLCKYFIEALEYALYVRLSTSTTRITVNLKFFFGAELIGVGQNWWKDCSNAMLTGTVTMLWDWSWCKRILDIKIKIDQKENKLASILRYHFLKQYFIMGQ